jgi:hypothetical protein
MSEHQEPKGRTKNRQQADSESSEQTKQESTAGHPQTTVAPYDPALDDQTEAVKERLEGRTSDPATRAEGTTASEVEPDTSDAAKATDAGPEAYPFPPAGDVDILLVEAGSGEGEYPPALNVDDWVVLDGSHDSVPDRLDGHLAIVVDAPSEPIPDSGRDPDHAIRTPVEDAAITVRTRDEADATLVIPFDAIKAVGRGGRSAVLPVA